MHRRFTESAIASTIIFAACAPSARADGGHLRAFESIGPWRVAVFTSPSPLCSGPIDVSVFLQQANSGATVRDLDVSVRAVHVASGATVSLVPSDSSAGDRLYQSRVGRLIESGTWDFTVTVADAHDAAATLTFTATAGEPSPPWVNHALSIAWPVIPIGLFIAHQWLVARKALAVRAP